MHPHPSGGDGIGVHHCRMAKHSMTSKVTIQLGEHYEGAPLLQDYATATEMAGCGPQLLRGRAAPLAGGRAVLRLPPSAESPKMRGERKRKEICGWGEVG